MLSKFCTTISHNKNLLMLITAIVYCLALFATLSGQSLLFSVFALLLALISIIKNYFPIKYIIIWTLLFYFGILNTSIRLKDVDELLNLAPVNSKISGTIISIPQGKAEGKLKFFFDVDNIEFNSVQKNFDREKVLVTMNAKENVDNLKLYNYGILEGRLSTPFKAGNPSQFDYGNYLRNHNAYAVFYANNFTIMDKNLSFQQKAMQKINNYRERIITLHSKYLPSPNLEILGGIVFGDDAVSPPKEIKQSFINSGLLHILAASGMNVAFIYTFFFWIFSQLRINYRLSVVLGMITVVVYSLMTGLGASVIRAACMLLFVLVGKLLDRDAHSISLLSFVALLMLIFNPLFINDVGFQLSFIVTFGILITAPAIMRFNNKIFDFVAGTVSIPIIAQLWVIPIQIFYFNNISLYSIFANIMSVPILMIVSFGGFVSSLIAGIKPIAGFVCMTFDFILNPLITLLVNISDFWGHLPNSTLQTSHPEVFQIILYYGILLCGTGLLYKEFRAKYLKKILLTSFILLSVWIVTLIPIKNTDLEILTFDVGNADCFLIKTPNNKYIMIDTGKSGYNGGKSQAEIIVLKYLKDRGIRNFDTLVVTHFDNDHCGGAVDLLNSIKIDKIYVNDLNHPSFAAKNIYETARKNNTQIVLAQNKQVIYEDTPLKIINYMGKISDNDNENSIITLLEYNDFKMLFTGDAGKNRINSLLEELPKNITVLKVPHHGAHNGLDKNIFSYLNPKYSIISVGENKFGHPNLHTLKLLNKSIILRTDIHNSILFKISQSDFCIKTYDIQQRRFVDFESF